MRLLIAITLLGLLTAFGPTPAQAQSSDIDSRRFLNLEAFLSSHPDIKNRLAGLEVYEKGRHAEALTLFRRAARYADKPSQSMLGEMYWQGTGTPRDRPLGYVWMDLAAERGYPLMLAKRENYWKQMDAQERARALEIGVALLAEYGDQAAQPRIALVLERERRNMTGSRVGNIGNLRVVIPTASGFRQISGESFYDATYWEPEQYFAWHDQDWKRTGKGTVEVGEVQTRLLPEDEAGQDDLP